MSDKQSYNLFIPGPPIAKGSMSGFPMPVKRDAPEPARDFYANELDYLRAAVSWWKGRKYRCVITHKTKDTPKWEGKIHREATALKVRMLAGDLLPMDRAISIQLKFCVPRPKSHILTDGLSLRKGYPKYPIKQGTKDIDKLTRCVLDALTGVFYNDDSQVCFMSVTKLYASTVVGDENGAGVHIGVTVHE